MDMENGQAIGGFGTYLEPGNHTTEMTNKTFTALFPRFQSFSWIFMKLILRAVIDNRRLRVCDSAKNKLFAKMTILTLNKCFASFTWKFYYVSQTCMLNYSRLTAHTSLVNGFDNKETLWQRHMLHCCKNILISTQYYDINLTCFSYRSNKQRWRDNSGI